MLSVWGVTEYLSGSGENEGHVHARVVMLIMTESMRIHDTINQSF